MRECLSLVRNIFVVSSLEHKLIRVDLTISAWTTGCRVRTIMHLSLIEWSCETFLKGVASYCRTPAAFFGSVAQRECAFEIWNARNSGIQKIDVLSFRVRILRDQIACAKLIREM